jgi:hypothetical protein
MTPMPEIAERMRAIQVRIESIAESESLPGETGVSLDETLAALTQAGRRRVAMMLNHICIASRAPHERKAAELVRMQAANTWTEECYVPPELY